ncbi:glycosyltransferase family 4 protein [Hydrocarboniphaga sp.]|uniref:glycosyltransferase family 4 protein n=1 Tax=Hydrocarboniphaga sp. TaxID=2033016 RepID=UPI003D0F7BAD
MSGICLFTRSWKSGAGWFAQELAQALGAQGAEVVFVAPPAEPANREPSHPGVRRVKPPRELVGSATWLRKFAVSSARVVLSCWAVLMARRRCKVFIASIPEPLLFTIPLFLLLRLTSAHVIYVVHDAVPHAWKFRGPLLAVEKFGHALSYRLASTLVTLTQSAKDDLVKIFGIAEEKISIIPHGVYKIEGLAPIPASDTLLIFGTLRKNKCVLECIEAIQLLRSEGYPTKLVVAGAPYKNEKEYWDECQRRIQCRSEGIEVHARFLSDDDLGPLFSRIDAVLLAYQGFSSQSGVAVLTALSGRPVIGTLAGGLGELYRQGMALEIVTAPVDVQAVVDAIKSFYARPTEEWQRASNEARDRLAEHLSWENIAKRYIALVQLSA